VVSEANGGRVYAAVMARRKGGEDSCIMGSSAMSIKIGMRPWSRPPWPPQLRGSSRYDRVCTEQLAPIWVLLTFRHVTCPGTDLTGSIRGGTQRRSGSSSASYSAIRTLQLLYPMLHTPGRRAFQALTATDSLSRESLFGHLRIFS
jgi:hypothetical protein